jgi:hypothetical protein
MRNIVIYINNANLIEVALERSNADNLDVEQLIVVFQLSELSKEVVPLIGDLRELRALKYSKLIKESYDQGAIKVRQFKPIIFQSDYTINEVEELLTKDSKTSFYLFTEPDPKLLRILGKLSLAYNVQVISMDVEDDLKAGE